MPRANLLVSIALLLTSVPVYSQTAKDRSPEDAIKLSTELVPLDVHVVGKKTRHAITGLSKTDFEVYEDGVKQQILQFSQDKLPLSVVLLLDASGSMWTVLEKLRATAHEALQTLKPEDEVAVVVTADDTRLVQDFTKDRFTVTEALRQLDFKAFGDNGIFLHDSLYRAATHLQRAANPGDRRLVIAVTDNVTIPNHNWRFFQQEQAESLLLEAGVVVCGLLVDHNKGIRAFLKITSLPARRSGGDLHVYAEMTGGEVLSVGGDTVGQRLIELINHLRTRYSLAFAPSNTKRDGKFRKIKVRLTDETDRRIRNSGSEDYAIATRSGYYGRKN